MITVYEAKSSIDANIVQDILSLEGVNSHIMGGYLEGGIGEIQTMGVIKLMVEEQDFQEAKKLIHDWENQKVYIDLDHEGDDKPTIEDKEAANEMLTPESHTNKTVFAMVPALVFMLVVALLLWYFFLPQ